MHIIHPVVLQQLAMQAAVELVRPAERSTSRRGRRRRWRRGTLWRVSAARIAAR